MKYADLIVPSNNENSGESMLLIIKELIIFLVARDFICHNLKSKLKSVFGIDCEKEKNL